MPLNPDVVESVSNANFKTIADQPALAANRGADLANLAFANAVSHQQSMNAILTAATGKIVELIASLDPTEALGNATVGQVASKTAGNTPPVTPTP